MSAHAMFSPSSAYRWMRCAGALAASLANSVRGDYSNVFAREGTAAHTLGERALQYASQGRKAEFWIGETISVAYVDDAGNKRSQDFVVDQEMADYVQVYVDQVLREPGELMVEQRVDLSEVFQIEDQFGTADAVVLDYENNRLYVGDLKYGRGNMVFVKDNEQLYSYAAGVLKAFDMVGDWQTITVAIHQPRLHHYDEHTLQRAELEAFIEEAAVAAGAANAMLAAPAEQIEAAKVAGEKQCQWCPIKGTCNTFAAWTHEQVYADFATLDVEPTQIREASGMDDALLDKLVRRSDAIEGATRAWRAELTRRLEAGTYSGTEFKLVQGRKGNRQWVDEDEAEKVMKAARIKQDEMYSRKLLTFPAAEKAFGKSKPKVWKKLAALMTQPKGKPAVAPASDPKPALVVAKSEQFDDVSEPSVPAELADLF